MKSVVFIVVSVMASFAFTSPVSSETAFAAANGWIAERHAIDESTEPVTGIVSVASSDGTTAYYKCIRSGDGGLIAMSSDTSLPPVLAVIPGDYTSTSEETRSDLWSMLIHDSTNMLSSVRGPKVLSTSRSPTSFQSRWISLLSGKGLPVRLASQAFGNHPATYVIPGFETGGKFTHWNQTCLGRNWRPKSGNGAPTYRAYSWKPIYNSYTRDKSSGGPETGGLQLHLRTGPILVPYGNHTYDAYVYDWVPCGCVATVLSAVSQSIGLSRSATYAVSTSMHYPSNAVFDFDSPGAYSKAFYNNINWTVVNPFYPQYHNRMIDEGVYDWDILDESRGGKSKYGKGVSISDEQRLLLGKVAYDLGVYSHSKYGQYETSAGFSDIAFSIKGDVAFPGFSDKWFGVYKVPYGSGSTWVKYGFVANEMIRAGRPAILGIKDLSEGSESMPHAYHAVVVTGYDEDTGFNRVFFGWGGTTDGWYNLSDGMSIQTSSYNFSLVSDIVGLSGYDGMAAPVYGRVVHTNGTFYSGIVTISTNGIVCAAARCDRDGYFRTFCPIPDVSPTTSSSPVRSYDETISVAGISVTTNRILCVYPDYNSENSGSLTFNGTNMFMTASRPTIMITSVQDDRFDMVGEWSGLKDAISCARSMNLPLVVIPGSSETNSTRALSFMQTDKARRSEVFIYYAVSSPLDTETMIVVNPFKWNGLGKIPTDPESVVVGVSYEEDDLRSYISDGISITKKWRLLR